MSRDEFKKSFNHRLVARLKQLGEGGGQANWLNKGVDLVSKTTTLHMHHTFWYISLPSLYADYHVKLPNFTFEGGRKKTTTNFPFSFSVNA